MPKARKRTTVAALMVLCALEFVLLYDVWGLGMAALIAVPVISGGWLLGACTGFIAALLGGLLSNTLLFNLTGPVGWDAIFRAWGGPGFAATVLLGVGSGLTSNSLGRVREQSRELEYRALHDPLAGLPNRALLVDRLEHGLYRAGRREDKVAVLFVELDNFKTVNDSLGHEVGDRLLAAVAERIRRALRVEDTAARLGGDRFCRFARGQG